MKTQKNAPTRLFEGSWLLLEDVTWEGHFSLQWWVCVSVPRAASAGPSQPGHLLSSHPSLLCGQAGGSWVIESSGGSCGLRSGQGFIHHSTSWHAEGHIVWQPSVSAAQPCPGAAEPALLSSALLEERRWKWCCSYPLAKLEAISFLPRIKYLEIFFWWPWKIHFCAIFSLFVQQIPGSVVAVLSQGKCSWPRGTWAQSCPSAVLIKMLLL